jgi:Ran GTPase-activating protein 1
LEAAPVVVAAIENVAEVLEDADMSDIIAGRPEAEVLQVLQAVSAALAKCKGLKVLNISDNALGEKGIRAFTDVLKSTSTLQALYLKNIGCSVNACKAVAELVACTSLQLLHLFNNMSDNEGATSIGTLVQRNSGIKVRDLFVCFNSKLYQIVSGIRVHGLLVCMCGNSASQTCTGAAFNHLPWS